MKKIELEQKIERMEQTIHLYEEVISNLVENNDKIVALKKTSPFDKLMMWLGVKDTPKDYSLEGHIVIVGQTGHINTLNLKADSTIFMPQRERSFGNMNVSLKRVRGIETKKPMRYGKR